MQYVINALPIKPKFFAVPRHSLSLVAASLVANTDTRFYLNLTHCVYRFYPMLLTKEDLSRIHGPDERISVTNVGRAVRFFYELVLRADRFQGLSSAK